MQRGEKSGERHTRKKSLDTYADVHLWHVFDSSQQREDPQEKDVEEAVYDQADAEEPHKMLPAVILDLHTLLENPVSALSCS